MALCPRHVGEAQRGDNPLHYGDTNNFGERIATDTEMTVFVIFAPSVLDRNDYNAIDEGDALPIIMLALPDP